MLMPTVFHENLFDDFFDPFWNDAALERMMNREARDTFGKRGANMMKTDVKQTDNGYEVAVDLPGCKKEDVQMDLNDGYLTIQAVRSHSKDEKDEKGRYLRRESFSGTCARSFYVGDVKKEDIHAKFEDGVLHVELPAPQQTKALPENPNLIEIEYKCRSCAPRHNAHRKPPESCKKPSGGFFASCSISDHGRRRGRNAPLDNFRFRLIMGGTDQGAADKPAGGENANET